MISLPLPRALFLSALDGVIEFVAMLVQGWAGLPADGQALNVTH